MNVHLRCAKGEVAYRDDPPEWLKVIWTANEIEPLFFGKPEKIEPWWAGGTVEEFEHARVIHRTDPTVSICSKTEHGAKRLIEVAEILGIRANPIVSVMRLRTEEES